MLSAFISLRWVADAIRRIPGSRLRHTKSYRQRVTDMLSSHWRAVNLTRPADGRVFSALNSVKIFAFGGWQIIMRDRSRFRQQLMFCAFCSLSAFALAHTVNAYIAFSLGQPMMISASGELAQEQHLASHDPKDRVRDILNSGLFALPPKTDVFEGNLRAALPPLDSSKKVSLVGTAIQSPSGGLAILEDLSSKQQTLYRLNDVVPTIGTIVEIQRDRILFRQGIQEEWLDLLLAKTSPPIPASIPSAPSSRTKNAPRIIARAELLQGATSTLRLLLDVEAIPNVKDGRVDGLRLDFLNFHGLLGRMGLMPGDVLTRINGVEIHHPGMLFASLKQLAEERTAKIDLLRKNVPQTLTYEIR